MSAYTALLSWSIRSVYTAIDYQDVSGVVDAVSKCRHVDGAGIAVIKLIKINFSPRKIKVIGGKA